MTLTLTRKIFRWLDSDSKGLWLWLYKNDSGTSLVCSLHPCSQLPCRVLHVALFARASRNNTIWTTQGITCAAHCNCCWFIMRTHMKASRQSLKLSMCSIV